MQTHTRIYTSQAPHIIGQEVLLEYAIEDFLGRVTRLKPWYRVRYETLLTDMEKHFAQLLRRPVPLAAFTNPLIDHWLEMQYPNPLAEQVVEEFQTYLLEWNWIESPKIVLL